MTFRNRCVVAGSSGTIHLSVPIVKGRNQHIPYKEVRICNSEKWQLKQWRTIASCYNRSPYFEFYRDSLEFYFSKQFDFLFDLNISILYWTKQVLGFPADIVVMDHLPDDILQGNEVVDLRNRWLPKNFQKEGTVIQYPQVFEDRIGFQPNLSILDLLLNTGTEAGNILKHG